MQQLTFFAALAVLFILCLAWAALPERNYSTALRGRPPRSARSRSPLVWQVWRTS